MSDIDTSMMLAKQIQMMTEQLTRIEDAMERKPVNKAMKITHKEITRFGNRLWECPSCKARCNTSSEYRYCPNCGVKLDWSIDESNS